MVVSNKTIVGYTIALVIIIAAVQRYFVLWVDYSQGVTYIFAGITIACFAWIYNEILKIKNLQTAMEEYLADEKK
jgi:TRAP-type uncharacterized transport system fused permease subunit